MTVAWIEQTAAEAPRSDEWLSAGERALLGRLSFEKRRADGRLGRWTATTAVSKWLGVPDLASIEIRPARSGAPRVFVAGDPAAASISLSHRDGRAMCAVAAPGTLLGCDIECVEPRSDAFATDYFTLAEQDAFSSGAARWTRIAVHWSAKESALKALGIGLGIDMRRLSVQFCDGAGWTPLAVRYAHLRTLHGWWCRADTIVRTIVAAPTPCAPVCLLDRF